MQKKIRLLLIPLVLFSISDVFSQKSKDGKKDNRKSETKEIQVFGDENKEYFSDTKGISAYNIVKINPIGAIFGDFPIFFERVIHPNVGLEILAGATLRPRYALPFNDLNIDSETLGSIDAKIGFMGGFELKYYPGRNDDAPDGFYMSIGSRYKKYNLLSYGYDEYGVALKGKPNFKTPLIVTDLVRVSAGTGNIRDNFFTDYFFGFALRSRNNTRAEAYVPDENTGLVATRLLNDKKLVPAFFIGFKLGFSF
jgi:hypothetical protein